MESARRAMVFSRGFIRPPGAKGTALVAACARRCRDLCRSLACQQDLQVHRLDRIALTSNRCRCRSSGCARGCRTGHSAQRGAPAPPGTAATTPGASPPTASGGHYEAGAAQPCPDGREFAPASARLRWTGAANGPPRAASASAAPNQVASDTQRRPAGDQRTPSLNHAVCLFRQERTWTGARPRQPDSVYSAWLAPACASAHMRETMVTTAGMSGLCGRLPRLHSAAQRDRYCFSRSFRAALSEVI